MKVFTTSWDDGNPADLRMVKLLDKYGLKGTFYVMYKKIISGDLKREYLKEISANHEVGSHLIDHVDLTKQTSDEAYRQLYESKKGLEEANGGVEVYMLSYPWGKYNDEVKKLVVKAGYIGARTIEVKPSILTFDSYEMPVTFGVWGGWNGDFNIKAVEEIAEKGGVFHLAGHCWELNEEQWSRLEEIFKVVSQIENLMFFPNSKVLLEGKVKHV